MIQHVRQQHPRGCVIACLAMISGVAYDEVARGFKGDRAVEGLSSFLYDLWLAQRGYAILRRYKHYSPLQAERTTWPGEPFADVHLVTVNLPPEGSHAVVMLADGSILDPNQGPEPRKLGDYADISYIAGIYKVREAFPPEPLIGLHWTNGVDRKCRWCGASVDNYKYHDPCPSRPGLTTV